MLQLTFLLHSAHELDRLVNIEQLVDVTFRDTVMQVPGSLGPPDPDVFNVVRDAAEYGLLNVLSWLCTTCRPHRRLMPSAALRRRP